jgi:morphogenesis family protein
MKLEVKPRGVRKTYEALESLGERGNDARPAWPFVMSDLQRSTKRRFDTEGASAGWPRVAASTLARDARGRRDPRLMRASGALEKALTADRARGGIRRRLKTQMRFGTSIFYAHFHQVGQGVPRRVLLDMDQRQVAAAADTLERHVVGKPQVR